MKDKFTPEEAQLVLATMFLNIVTGDDQPGRGKAQDWERVLVDFHEVKKALSRLFPGQQDKKNRIEALLFRFEISLNEWRGYDGKNYS